MNAQDYNLMRIEESNKLIPLAFRIKIPITKVLFDDIETGPSSYATIFKSGDDTYVLLEAEDGHEQTLGDVRRIVRNMGLEAQQFFPPAADPFYFYREGVNHFLKAYPGRKDWKDEDIDFYQSLAAYNPALVQLSAVNGAVCRFNICTNSWQKAFNYNFKKVRIV